MIHSKRSLWQFVPSLTPPRMKLYMGPATHHVKYILYIWQTNIVMSIRQRVTLNNMPFYQVVPMLLMLITWAVEVLYILHQIWVIMGYKDNNKNRKISETSILFTRSGGILSLPLLELLLNLEMYSQDPLEILYLEGLKTSCRVPHNYIISQILLVPWKMMIRDRTYIQKK